VPDARSLVAERDLNVYSHLFADDLGTLGERLYDAKIKSGADQVRTSSPVIMLPNGRPGDRDAV
jgi:hypothetical protein